MAQFRMCVKPSRLGFGNRMPSYAFSATLQIPPNVTSPLGCIQSPHCPSYDDTERRHRQCLVIPVSNRNFEIAERVGWKLGRLVSNQCEQLPAYI